jgi:hypothetical protein
MTPSSPLRRFQFRLRTLLIVVTVLSAVCGYLGWQAKIVQERKAKLILELQHDEPPLNHPAE